MALISYFISFYWHNHKPLYLDSEWVGAKEKMSDYDLNTGTWELVGFDGLYFYWRHEPINL